MNWIIVAVIVAVLYPLVTISWRCRKCRARYEGSFITFLIHVCQHPEPKQ